MPPPKGPCWDEVEYAPEHTDRKPVVICNHCTSKIHGGAVRIVAHLAGMPGKGVAPCTEAPESVREKYRGILQTKAGNKQRAVVLQQLDAATSSGNSSLTNMTGASAAPTQLSIVDALQPARKETVRI